MKATCYNKNIPVFTCEIENGSLTKIKEVLDEEHLPIMLQDTIPSVSEYNRWLNGRKIPEKRVGLKQARKHFPGFLQYRNMFSLSDQYWFRYNKKETWENGNFFTNPFSEGIGRIFFAPWTVEDLRENPDLTTNGVLRKRWVIREGKRLLIKAGHSGFHQNPIAEILASMTLEQMDLLPFVRYRLEVDGLQLCCVCENFIDENTEYVPFIQIYEKEPRSDSTTIYEHSIRMAKAFGVEQSFIDRMLCADHFICNTDRHLGNFGLIRDVETGRLLRFAPLFDCGSAYYAEDSPVGGFREPRRVEQFLPGLRKKKYDREPLIRLAEKYPLISEARAETIISSIHRVFDELEGRS